MIVNCSNPRLRAIIKFISTRYHYILFILRPLNQIEDWYKFDNAKLWFNRNIDIIIYLIIFFDTCAQISFCSNIKLNLPLPQKLVNSMLAEFKISNPKNNWKVNCTHHININLTLNLDVKCYQLGELNLMKLKVQWINLNDWKSQ